MPDLPTAVHALLSVVAMIEWRDSAVVPNLIAPIGWVPPIEVNDLSTICSLLQPEYHRDFVNVLVQYGMLGFSIFDEKEFWLILLSEPVSRGKYYEIQDSNSDLESCFSRLGRFITDNTISGGGHGPDDALSFRAEPVNVQYQSRVQSTVTDQPELVTATLPTAKDIRAHRRAKLKANPSADVVAEFAVALPRTDEERRARRRMRDAANAEKRMEDPAAYAEFKAKRRAQDKRRRDMQKAKVSDGTTISAGGNDPNAALSFRAKLVNVQYQSRVPSVSDQLKLQATILRTAEQTRADQRKLIARGADKSRAHRRAMAAARTAKRTANPAADADVGGNDPVATLSFREDSAEVQYESLVQTPNLDQPEMVAAILRADEERRARRRKRDAASAAKRKKDPEADAEFRAKRSAYRKSYRSQHESRVQSPVVDQRELAAAVLRANEQRRARRAARDAQFYAKRRAEDQARRDKLKANASEEPAFPAATLLRTPSNAELISG